MFRLYYLWLLLTTVGIGGLQAQSVVPPSTSTENDASPALIPTRLRPNQIQGLTALGQLWGFLKYYHPAVAAGQHNWDAELLHQLPQVLACRTVAQQRRLLSTWVSSLGPVPACVTCSTLPPRPVHSAPVLSWMQNSRLFTATLRRQLAFIQANRYQGKPHYVGQAPAGNPTFPHEEAYAAQRCPDAGLRILALYRYWNMVQYFSPYKDILQEDWSRVLPDLLPLFVAADTPLRYRHAVLTLSARLQDGHATLAPDALLEQEAGEYLVPTAVQFIGEQAVVQRVRRDGGPVSPLQPGDVITQVAGQAVSALVRQRLPETPGSNHAARLRQIARELLFSSTPDLTLTVIREGQPLRLTAPSRLIAALTPVPRVAADSLYRFLTPDIGYIDMAQMRKEKLPLIMQTFRRTQGLVIDLRNYPGDFVPHQLAGYFLAQPTLFARYSQFDSGFPGRFLTSEPDTLLPQPGAGLPYTGQVVVLVNATTLSLGEFTAMALRATPHCTILGSQTAGADGNRTRMVLPGGLVTGMSGLGVFYPDGRPTQGVGIVPDIKLLPTPAGFRAGRDELRERAVELLTNRRTTP